MKGIYKIIVIIVIVIINIVIISAVIGSVKNYIDKINRGEIEQPVESDEEIQQDMGEKIMQMIRTLNIEIILKIVLAIVGMVLLVAGFVIVIKI